jgi:hypothetical protein
MRDSKMSDKSQKVEKPIGIRRGLLLRINNLLILIYDLVFYYENEKLGYVDEKAKKIKAENLDGDAIAYRLALAEAKLEVYESYLNRLTKAVNELNILETAPSKAGKKRNELAYSVAWDIYDSYFKEHKKHPSAEELSSICGDRLAVIKGLPIAANNGDDLLPISTARDYITRFKKVTDGN